MSRHPLENMVRGLRKLVSSHELGQLSDGQLLERFVIRREEAAFAALMQRHGAMVLGVCRRVLGRVQDAEDACQATFLVLIRRAAAIRRGDSLASWLYGVAYRIARQLQARTRRDRTAADLDPPAPNVDPTADLSWREVWGLLDAELQRLAEHYRQPLILCYLEGKTRDEAARELHWPLGTLKRRLEQGRNLLRARLTRRGVTLPAALCGAALGSGMTSAALPPLLMVQTSKAALALAAGQAPSAVLAPPLATLLESGMPAVGMVKVKAVAALLLIVTLLSGGVAVWRYPKAGEQGLSQSPPLLAQQTVRRGPPSIPKADDPPDGALARLGTHRLRHGSQVRSVAVSPDGKVLASAGWDWAVRLWDMQTGQELRSISGPDGWFWCVAFSPDGTKLAAGGDKRDRKIHLYDAATGAELRRFEGHAEGAYAVAFSPDGQTLASGGPDAVIRLWNLASGAERSQLTGHRGAIRTLAFADAGRTLASGGDDATIRRWPDDDFGERRRDASPLGRGCRRGATMPHGTGGCDPGGRLRPGRPARGLRRRRGSCVPVADSYG
jgi:RNA polymerase sigma factor (sigma-70 family)